MRAAKSGAPPFAARFFAGKYIFTFMLESRCILFRNFQLPDQLEFMYNH